MNVEARRISREVRARVMRGKLPRDGSKSSGFQSKALFSPVRLASSERRVCLISEFSSLLRFAILGDDHH